MTTGHERPKGIELAFFVAASLLAICFGAKFGCDMRALRTENTALRARLDWWECKQPEQPGSPTLIEVERIPQEEIDEAVPLTGGLDSLKGVADETEPPLQGSEPPLYGAVGAAAPNARSGKWPALQHRYVAKRPDSEWKGSKTPRQGINVHHKIPVSWSRKAGHPWLELCEANLITLDSSTHLAYGHGGNFRLFNLDIAHDAKVGKFNSRGLSEWPGDDEMLKFLVWALGPPSDVQPDELPLVITDPKAAWDAWKMTVEQ